MHQFIHVINHAISISLTFILTIHSVQATSANIKFDQLGPIVIPNCVLQDSYGFIWIGAQEGLIRYDGYNFKRYTQIPFDSTSLSINWVNVIQEDNSGNLWIGTNGGGLNYFNQKTEKFIHYIHQPGKKNSIGSNIITDMVVNEDGSLWIGTMNNGLVLLQYMTSNEPVFTHFDLSSVADTKIPSGENFVLDIFRDKQGILWIGTIQGGLKRLDPETGDLRHYKHEPDHPFSINDNTVSSIVEDDFENLWLGTGHITENDGGGLNLFDRKNGQFTHYLHDPNDRTSLSANRISSMVLDSKNVLWIGTSGGQLNSISIDKLLSEKKPEFKHYSEFPRNFINSVYEDRSGNIWAALFGRTVHKMDRQQNSFIWYRKITGDPNSLSSRGVQCIFLDKQGRLWCGGDDGLDAYDPVTGRYSHYYHNPDDPQSLTTSAINGICQDDDGCVWISTPNMGINRFDPRNKTFKRFLHHPGDSSGLKTNLIKNILWSSSGYLWMSSYNAGLLLFDPDENRCVSFDINPNSQEDERITYIYEDYLGILWVCTFNDGLYGLTLKNRKIVKTVHYRYDPYNSNSLSNNLVSDVIRSEVGDSCMLWIATGIGLNRLDLNSGRFTHFFKDDGVSDNLILKVLQDNDGTIWFTTAAGLDMLNPVTGDIRNFGEQDGLPFTHFGGSRPNTAKSPDGVLYFGGVFGVVSFNPREIKKNTNIPPVRLTGLKIFNQDVESDTAIQFKRNLVLAHHQNMFSFQFSALDFTNPSNNQYAYKLDGFHDDWIQCGNERTAGFTNLDPGEYVFHVKGSNNHGVWNETGHSINITILPPWWRTSWAYASYVIIILVILYSVRQYDLKRQRLKHELALEHEQARKLQEIDRMKSCFFANISHEFRTPLTLILGPLNKWLPRLRTINLKQDLQMMQRNARSLLRLINQLLDLSKLESGGMTLQTGKEDMVQLLRGYVQSFESLARIKKIDLHFTAENNSIDAYVDREKIEKIMYNLLSNAFKFTPEGGTAEVSVTSLSSASPLMNKGGIKGRSEECVIISISDSGKGVPADRIDKIFDRFFRIEDSDVKEHEGTGIGLALTKELIELHHGQISVESSPEAGTTFTIKLPLGKDHLKEKEIVGSIPLSAQEDIEPLSETEIVKDGKPQHIKGLPLILIVEDNADVRFYIRGYIESNYRIIEAVDGKEGLQKAIEKIPDLIISDVMMPEMNGFELCLKLKTDERTSHIPVILLTARADSQDKINGLETGADDYLTKPFDVKELLVRIKNLISQREKLRNHYLKTFSLEYNNSDYTSVDKKFLAKIKSKIEEHLSDSEYSVSEFAREIGFSHSQLIRKLESLTGLKPSLFIRSFRLQRAKQMFDQKSGNISQVAYDCGFNNLSYFSRSFKVQFGLLPSEYMKQTS